jgi:hypothetical protein
MLLIVEGRRDFHHKGTKDTKKTGRKPRQNHGEQNHENKSMKSRTRFLLSWGSIG